MGKPCSRVAWIFHAVDGQDLAALDPALAEFSDENSPDMPEDLLNPAVLEPVRVRSAAGVSTTLMPIMLPVTSRWMKDRMESGRRRECGLLVQRAVETARQLRCGIAALGQYTSIVTRNGRSIRASDIGITTGNSYTIALSIQAVFRSLSDAGTDSRDCTLVVAGAAGNIGRACAEILAPKFRSTVLLGTDRLNSRLRLNDIADSLPRTSVDTDPMAVRRADVVVAAVNSVNTPFRSVHFAPQAVVCDVSVPPAVHPDTAEQRPDLDLVAGGIVRLPFGEDLQLPRFPLPTGYTFGCMAEGLLLAFEGICDTSFTGLLTPDQVQRVEHFADRHGFEPAEHSVCVLSSAREKAETHVGH